MKPTTAAFRKQFLHNPITLVISVILLFFATQVIGGILAGFLVLPYVSSKSFQLLAIIACNTFALVGLLYALRNVAGLSFAALGLKRPSRSALVRVIPAFVVYFVSSAALTYIITTLVSSFQADQAQDIGLSTLTSSPELVAGFLSLVVLTPIFEEVLFRGILFRGLRKSTSFWASAVVTSVVFGLAHFQWNVAVDVFALSLILCYLVEKTGGIVPAIALHSLKNSLAFVLLFIIGT